MPVFQVFQDNFFYYSRNSFANKRYFIEFTSVFIYESANQVRVISFQTKRLIQWAMSEQYSWVF